MLRSIGFALLAIASISTAEASPGPADQFAGDRYSAIQPHALDANRSVRHQHQGRRQRRNLANPLIYRPRPQAITRHLQGSPGKSTRRLPSRSGKRWQLARHPRHLARAGVAAGAFLDRGRQIGATILGGRPSGCPSRFCGCALSIRVFGHSVRNLWLASNWLRFPRTSPAPGMVAARRGHVFQLLAHLGGSHWRVYDPNSGRGRIREHARSIAGYAIVNPRHQLAGL